MRVFCAFVLLSFLSLELAAQQMAVGIESVSPLPGSSDVSLDTTIRLDFAERTSFSYTDYSPLQVIDVESGLPVFSVDPYPGDPQEGLLHYSVQLPAGTLQADKQYAVDVAPTFSRMNVAPWVTAAITADQWQFTTGSGVANALPIVVEGNAQVFPAPGASGVNTDSAIDVYFEHSVAFEYIDNSASAFRKSGQTELLISFDPVAGDAATGGQLLRSQLQSGN